MGIDIEQLTPEAQAALTIELARRRIDHTEVLKPQEKIEQGRVGQPTIGASLLPIASHPAGEFLAEVYGVYRRHLWLYVRLVAPAVMLGYIAVVLGRSETREIAKHLPRGFEALSHKTEILEMWLANLGEYFVSWMAFSSSFGAICSATGQITAGNVPSALDCFAEVRERTGSFIRLSLLLFFLSLMAAAAAGLLTMGALWISHELRYHLYGYAARFVSIVSLGLTILVFSRFGLAIPALILDNCSVGQAMFRSDELTEGKWVTLAILLSKSLVGGYVAGMFPFWLTGWIWPYVRLPRWFAEIASIAGVSVVEPFMFIGFALLYLKTAVPSPTASSEVTDWQFA